MILVDTSVWVDHLRSGDPDLAGRLETGEVLSHPFVIGELALGNLAQRATVLEALRNLPQATPASDDEVLGFIEAEALHGLGVGYVDAHLLASARLTRDARLWTRDRRLQEIAARLGVAWTHPA
ncbi:MAG: type II toxin-antitoxin system VapC family toxin [Phenylobacterium sp.]|uniref:type II toxin-antitoxin system VapC family toxin n=1 Tax=Phenylobacterium sp. TaxID=1871053 RepID=UPI002735F071|nr:type II toxin-antitoxin system VapC family toxin [Phenylobacterium sp.]MDP3746457.1 type II toxin-antitoxin system VapC family toxin [Phenylobacterium sp.]